MDTIAKRHDKEKRGQINFDGKACWIGADVHKLNYAVALLCEDGQRLEFSTLADPRKLLLQLLKMGISIKALCHET